MVWFDHSTAVWHVLRLRMSGRAASWKEWDRGVDSRTPRDPREAMKAVELIIHCGLRGCRVGTGDAVRGLPTVD